MSDIDNVGWMKFAKWLYPPKLVFMGSGKSEWNSVWGKVLSGSTFAIGDSFIFDTKHAVHWKWVAINLENIFMSSYIFAICWNISEDTCLILSCPLRQYMSMFLAELELGFVASLTCIVMGWSPLFIVIYIAISAVLRYTFVKMKKPLKFLIVFKSNNSNDSDIRWPVNIFDVNSSAW